MLLLQRNGSALLEVLDPRTMQSQLSYRSKPDSKWQVTHLASDVAGRLFVKSDVIVAQVQ